MKTENTFIINSEETFNEYIQKILTECDLDQEAFTFPQAQFDGWPVLHFNVKGGEKYQSTVTSYLIEGLKDFTDEIFRAICVVKYGKGDLRYLKETDREQFDLVIKIAEGSSDGEGSAANIANSFFTNMNSTLQSMNGWKQLVAFIAFIGAIGGTVSFLGNEYLQFQTAETKAQVDIANKLSDNAKEMLDSQAKALLEMNKQQNETIRALLAEKAIQNKTTFSEELENHGEKASESFMKQIAKDPTVTEATVQSTTASGDELKKYKDKAITERITNDTAGDFYIKGLERIGTLGDTLSITAQRTDGIIFTLKVKVEKLQQFEKDILTNELVIPDESRQPIRLAYKETLRDGKKSGVGELVSVAYKEVKN